MTFNIDRRTDARIHNSSANVYPSFPTDYYGDLEEKYIINNTPKKESIMFSTSNYFRVSLRIMNEDIRVINGTKF
jgi:hypothetical protein